MIFSNLRIGLRNGAVCAAKLKRNDESSERLFFCNFDSDWGLENQELNGLNFNFDTQTAIINNSYQGGILGCDNVRVNLQEDWSVEFKYTYCGEMLTSSDKRLDCLASTWNNIFCWGLHLADPNIGRGVSWPRFALCLGVPKNLPKDCAVLYTKQVDKDPHAYKIRYTKSDKKTVISVDGTVKSTLLSVVYPTDHEGFYLSGGDFGFSLSCTVEEFRLSAALKGGR